MGLYREPEVQDITEVHTSSRKAYRRCRRKWHLGTLLNLTPIGDTNFHLWFGTGFHFALEDWHGERRFDSPIEAFKAYYNAFSIEDRPPGDEEAIDLAERMFDHYLNNWLPQRGGQYKTYYIDGEPQVEVDFTFTLPALSDDLGIEVLYKGTFDRVVEDNNGDLWVEDYKTITQMDTEKLATDPQISLYKWAAETWYGRPVEGVLYTQFCKKAPKEPKRLKSGKLSVDKRQRTTHAQYRRELLKDFPDADFPQKYIKMLTHLAKQETPEGDKYIRRDEVFRNTAEGESEYVHMYNEIKDMYTAVTKDRLYPNKTRDCSWDCPYRTVCIAMDDGSDFEHLIDTMYEVQDRKGREEWREFINLGKEGKDE